ncbi:hypothetical protein KDL01_12960 [Actinospica durhamensis]|uniref:Insecticidal toxin complex protein n=1 Tax=Actinospica durhamensis TaxID=1508375 RepID=A0A941IRQ8_9ACTN|nr:neuraminidase-like domain-containing protein [Actinospica durhamensis]MBR7834178.1 hypothetical protein [Actinospica durhamensis]
MAGLTPGFVVPAEYFYALGAAMPMSIDAATRLTIAGGQSESALTAQMQQALDAGTIASAGLITPLQAARRILAVTAVKGTEPPCRIGPSDDASTLVTDWLAGTDPDDKLWSNLLTTGSASAKAKHRRGQLKLILCALTGFDDTSASTVLSDLVAAVQQPLGSPPGSTGLGVSDADGLAQVTADAWTAFLTAHPQFLAPFTNPPGAYTSTTDRIRAFLRSVQHFYTTGTATPADLTLAPGSAPMLDRYGFDPLQSFLVEYYDATGVAFTFGTSAAADASAQAAIAAVFPTDAAAAAWLTLAVAAISDLAAVTAGLVPAASKNAASLEFSIIEALYARGFTSKSAIAALDQADFGAAVAGSVAFQWAAAIWTNAGGVAGGSGGQPGPFVPVNPDGTLTDCIPPEQLSPLGPVAYLSELLSAGPDSTCDAVRSPSGNDFASALLDRRGDLGGLLATAANLSTRLPVVDLVNECLENMASAVATSAGPVCGKEYETAGDAVGDHRLAPPGSDGEPGAAPGDPYRHGPAALFAALPEHSSPASPVAAPGGYAALAADFSSPLLPYSQPLDVSRSSLRAAGSSRFALLRHFRASITEFVLDVTDPAGFDTTLWRLPVRRDIAIEYLGLDPAEYQQLFATPIATATPVPAGELAAWTLYGFAQNADQDVDWTSTALTLSEFLARTGLDYCEFVELWRSGFVPFHRLPSDDGNRQGDGKGDGGSRSTDFGDCPPCDLSRERIVFGQPGTDGSDGSDVPTVATQLVQLAVFIRLWRKLRTRGCEGYTFTQLADICTVLGLFTGGGDSVDAGFPAQLAAFQMLRDDLCLPLGFVEDPSASVSGAGRTRLLALWAPDPAAVQDAWTWALAQVMSRLQAYAAERHACERRAPEFLKVLTDNLDPLSVLAGFDPATPTDTWHASPTRTQRMVEVLAKVYASPFTVGDLELLFSGTHVTGEDAFPLQTEGDAIDDPLELPDDEHEHSLWVLRRRLLDAESDLDEDELPRWTWPRIQSSFSEEFGYAPSSGTDPLTALAEHAFPNVLEREGQSVPPVARRYRSPLSAAATTPGMWNGDPDGAFHYDAATEYLWSELPLSDERVLQSLARLRQLKGGAAGASELLAVQEVYWQARQQLAALGLLFPDLAEADRQLLQHGDEEARWHYFRRAFVLARRRCLIIAEHLARHADPAARADADRDGDHDRHEHDRHEHRHDHDRHEHRHDHDRQERAWLVLRTLHADENFAAGSWEQADGSAPPLTWAQPTGGAFAALLGLCGTGLLTEYAAAGAAPLWRETSGALDAFGADRSHWNAPVPTLLPALDTPTPAGGEVTVQNGIARSDERDVRLGGAQGFTVTWTGVLLIERPGRHRFAAGAPAPRGHRPDLERAERCAWRIRLSRGQRSWVLLSHGWSGPGPDTAPETELDLKRGAYTLTIELERPTPAYHQPDDVRGQHAGFELAYAGPDTDGELIPIPRTRLYLAEKTASLGDRIELASPSAQAALVGRYPGSLRDIRRTYQRAYLALRLVSRFSLSARRHEDGQSELGYLLAHPDRFAGTAFHRSSSGFVQSAAHFDLDFLPVTDTYLPPTATQDLRAAPTVPRQAALFDCWERLFDYTGLRLKDRHAPRRGVWRLFQTADEANPGDVLQLAPHLDVELDHNDLVQQFDGLQALLGKGELTAQNLTDERWPIRCLHAERWIRRLEAACAHAPIAEARPALWAAEDPGAGTPSGNDSLTAFLQDAMLESGAPRRYRDLRDLDDGLRERARRALLAYLCAMDRVPLPGPTATWAGRPRDLSDLLLLDVEAGLGERSSRIEDAVSAVQAFVRRARLHLEYGVTLPAAFLSLWDGRFASFRCWQACKRRELYPENSIEWTELEHARRDEGFRFLESELRTRALTIPVPAGIEHWTAPAVPAHAGLTVIQAQQPSTLHLPVAPQTAGPADAAVPTEAFGLLGRPERAAQPSWLALLTTDSPPSPTGGNQIGGQPRAAADTQPTDVSSAPTASTPPPNAVHGDEPSSVVVPPPLPAARLPYWIEAAVGLGVRFLRVAASGEPVGSSVLVGEGTGRDCCADCGAIHPPNVDEYYFWLADSRFYDLPDPQDADRYGSTDDDSDWENPAQFPKLLQWDSQPMVHLHWCRVHNGEFGELRRSSEGVALDGSQPLDPAGPPTLELRGRRGDSLVFRVDDGSGGAGTIAQSSGGSGFTWQPPYTGWNAETGWRYDLAADDAVLLPLVVTAPDPELLAPPMPGTESFGGLAAYPFFAYFRPGAPLLPLSAFAPALAVADTLRAHCRYEDALNWYRTYYDPFAGDNTWDPGNPPTPAVARQRASLLAQTETLVAWGDALLGTHCGCGGQSEGAPESYAMARTVLDAARTVLGPTPRTVVQGPPSGTAPTVSGFSPLTPRLNPRLMSVYERVQDRLTLIHERDDRRRRRYGEPTSYWGADPVRDGWRTAEGHCCDEGCCPPNPYRFVFLLAKALELAGQVRSFGSALLSAYEKGDGEHLAALRASHERQMHHLTLAVRQDQWRDSDWQVQALKQAKLSAHNQLSYYTGLVDGGLNSNENLSADLTGVGIGLQVAAQVFEMIAQLGGVIPDAYVGTMDFVKIPMTGSSFTNFFNSAGKALGYLAQDVHAGAGLALTEGGWDRRLAEWQHQVDIYTIEIEKLMREILGAERRSDAALRELNNQQRAAEASTEVEQFLRDKFTNRALYLYHQRETAALHRRAYELALETARQAERAFNHERGEKAQSFVDGELWDDLHEGLLAGERLEFALRRMEKAYLDRNRREYELTKHVSLRRDFPLALLRLKNEGVCEIEIPEWMFDLDYPGQYLRRLKNVTLTIPCVVGPYTGVHCRLTLLGGVTRVDPRLLGPVARCCGRPVRECACPGEIRDGDAQGYRAIPGDPRIVRSFAATDAIATSSAQHDGGMFELNFRDERYLPFEFAGAVSRWRIELPRENNQFDFDSISDLVLHLNYTAREGGDALRRAAATESAGRLPGNGMRLFDVRYDFPDAWAALRPGREHRPGHPRVLRPELSSALFPFVQGRRVREVGKLLLFFAAPDAEPGRHHLVRFRPVEQEQEQEQEQERDGDGRGGDGRDWDGRDGRDLVQDVTCVATAAWPGLFCGVVDLAETPLRPLPEELAQALFTFEFPDSVGEICGVYLLAGYEAACRPRCGDEPARPCSCGCGR